MKLVFAVAEITLARLREPAFVIFMLIAAGMGFGTSEMGALSFKGDFSVLAVVLSNSQGVPVLSCFSIVLVATIMMAVFIGATDIPRDINSGMVMLVLSKPVGRMEYVIGKYVGVVAVCLVFFGVAVAGIVIGHMVRAGECFSLEVLARQGVASLIIFPFVAVTIAVSTFLDDMGAMIATVLYVGLGMAMSSAAVLLEMLPRGLNSAPFFYALYFLFPNFLHYFHSFQLSGLVLVALLAYTFSLTMIFLGVAIVRLGFKDMV